ncbi:hypothetical protein HQ325_02360 [Rhodococcus sp. BP-349]|uniref:hypothetical protein n=1 Tax=unclassified Rhodococcus (in: high G+C Gram-positive bacteria) TaxID=192944 RepID=UPI001C9A6590|nr:MULTISPECIES: hypothetical protein [unclassified Rhodococcus (in: high G+C Gram-positive bacteria)]MBY6537505.1 hypothetical protein [Rhodococcus sp. BP-363]MBY6541842.1 hypothetical protein [Rhodococcus sp. BP-369]MBY6561072.1 hypothetical protein [Rhodococcus sp. BP-370]MBY6575364.1 hypothetical protein [Rhodococcus sp. BP-364]MBY6584665.1 hypothetical protein [Rhodococcus sp. BP-358]
MRFGQWVMGVVTGGVLVVAGAGTAEAAEVPDPVRGVAESLEVVVDECSSGMLSGALSGASVGGMLGAAGGPLGVAVGAAVGGFVGEVGGGETSCEDRVVTGRAVADPDQITRGHTGVRRR